MQRTSPHAPLTSKDNSAVKDLRSLADPKHRKKAQAFLIEGVKMVEEALRDNAGVKTIVASPDLVRHHGKGVLRLAEDNGVEVLWISERLMDAVAESKTPQPVMAVVAMKTHSEDELFVSPQGLIVVAHELQDPGNLGTIIRTAEAVNASGVVTTSQTVDPYNPKAVRASMGSILRVPIVHVGSLPDFIKQCRQKGYRAFATTLTATKIHLEADFTKPSILILGQEGAGLPQDIIDDIDVTLRIPMTGAVESLNVAVAAAVILYEAMRQRMKT
jgi:TrmH family RNA methyltransferase